MYNIRRGGPVFLLDYFIHIMYSAFKNIMDGLEQISFSPIIARGGKKERKKYDITGQATPGPFIDSSNYVQKRHLSLINTRFRGCNG